MNIILYSNSAENERINKTSFLTEKGTYIGAFRGEASILSPKIEIQSNGLISANYCYIEDFGRYYFINDIVCYRLGFFILSLTVDVLMSHKDSLLQLYAYVERYEKSTETGYKDNKFPIKYVPKIEAFGNFIVDYANPQDPYLIIIFDSSNEDQFSQAPVAQISYDGHTWVVGYSDKGSLNPINKSIRVYAVKLTYATSFLKLFIDDTALMSHILSINIAPRLVIVTEGDDANVKEVTSIKVGDTDISFSPAVYEVLNNFSVSNTYDYFFNFSQLPENFLLYEPYSKFNIYLPLYGNYEISSKYIIGKYLIIRLVFDVTVCKYTCAIYSADADNPIPITVDILTIDSGISVPATATGISDSQRQTSYNQIAKGISVINAGNKAISSTVGSVSASPFIGAAGAGLGALSSAIGFGMNVAAAEAQYEANEILNVPVGANGVINSYSLMYSVSPNILILYRVYVDTAITSDDFAKLNGLPYNKYVQLNTLSGFFKVGKIHLENLPNALNVEKDQLNSLLLSGVIS